MAFQAIKFPNLKLKHGNIKETIDPITITGNGTREVRRKQNRWDRYSWTIPSRQLIESDKLALIKFFRQVESGLTSFLYQDPDFPEFNGHTLQNRSGSTWYLNVPYDLITPGTHPIFHPQLGELTFKVNGTNASTTFAIDSNGFPYVTIAGSSSGSTITVYGNVYMTARFDSSITTTITAMEKSTLNNSCIVKPTVSSISDIKLIEVFE